MPRAQLTAMFMFLAARKSISLTPGFWQAVIDMTQSQIHGRVAWPCHPPGKVRLQALLMESATLSGVKVVKTPVTSHP